MNIKESIKTLFADPATSVGDKTDAVAFLRRFASNVRPLANYSCRGRTTKTIVRLLDNAGFENGKDYQVIASALDQEFNQIRWAVNTKKISALTKCLSTLVTTCPSYFDMMYVRITRKQDVTDLLEKITEIDGTQILVRASVNENHIAVKLMKRTAQIVKEMQEPAFADQAAKETAKNFKLANAAAMGFIAENFTADGKPKSENSPYILPVSVLEVYARVTKKCDPHPIGTGAYLFKTSPAAIDLFRLARRRERIMWLACLNAPLSYLYSKGSNSDENTLKGYFFRGADAVTKANLEDKALLFIGGNAELINDSAAEDNVTPALCTSNRGMFWQYVVELYRESYGFNVGLSCQSRLAVNVKSSAWGGSNPYCNLSSCRSNSTDVMKHENKWDWSTSTAMMAMYALFIADHISDGYTDPIDFTAIHKAVKVVPVDESSKPKFDDTHLKKEELAYEWFAMTHLDEAAGKQTNNDWCYDRGSSSGLSAELANMQVFKRMIKGLNSKKMKRLSSCVDNEFLAPKETDDVPRYTPLSAMLDGVCISFRRLFNNNDGTTRPPMVVREGRSSDLLVTNVYSGVYSDMSPFVGSAEDTGDVFPNPNTASGHTTDIGSCLGDTTEEREAFTKFLDRLVSGDTMEQVRFAKRTEGTLRRHVMLIETNIDAKAFFERVASQKLAECIGTLFIQSIILGYSNPTCAFGTSELEYSAANTRYNWHEVMMDRASGAWSKSTKTSSSIRLPSGTYSTSADFGGHVNVTSRCDSFGRLVLILTVDGDIATYSKFVYRYRCCFPMETSRVKAALFTGFNDYEIAMVGDSWNSRVLAIRAVESALRRDAYDYHGEYDYSENKLSLGPMFRTPIAAVFSAETAPVRSWFVDYSGGRRNFLDCAAVTYV